MYGRRQLGIIAAIILLALGIVPWAAMAADGSEGVGAASIEDTLRVEWAWARPGLTGGTTAVYFSLSNDGETAVRLVDAESDVAATVELHETTFSTDDRGGQMMHMDRIDSVTIEPGETVEFVPAGLHVMLIGLHEGLREGDEVDVALIIEGREDPHTLRVPVLRLGPGADDGVDHDHHHHHHDHHHHHHHH